MLPFPQGTDLKTSPRNQPQVTKPRYKVGQARWRHPISGGLHTVSLATKEYEPCPLRAFLGANSNQGDRLGQMSTIR